MRLPIRPLSSILRGLGELSIDARQYRDVIGAFATGVSVVTTCHQDRLHGFTANSLTSVSLDPMLLLVCVDRNATAHKQLEAASHFGVSILSDAQQELSNAFARSSEPEHDRLGGYDYRMGKHGTPLLSESIACLECRISDRLEGGDHSIFLGEVLEGELLSRELPLLYFRGAYRRIAPE